MSSPAWAYRYIPIFGEEPSKCLKKDTYGKLKELGKLNRFTTLCHTLGIYLAEAENREFEVVKDYDKLFEEIAEIALLSQEEVSGRLHRLLSYEYFDHFQGPSGLSI